MKRFKFYSSLLSWLFIAISIVIMISIASNIRDLSNSIEIFRSRVVGTGILEDLVGSAIAALGLGAQDSPTYLQDATSSSIEVLQLGGIIFIKILTSIYFALIGLFLKK